MRRIKLSIGILAAAGLFFSTNEAHAQQKELKKSGAAQYVLKQADQEFNLYNYSKAIDIYEAAYDRKETLRAAQGIADSYRKMNNYKFAASWYEKVTKMPENDVKNKLYYAEALKNNFRFAEAKEKYQEYAAANSEVSKEQLDMWIAGCDSAIAWVKHPADNIKLTNEASYNTKFSDWGLVMNNDNSFFTSDRTNKEAEKGKKSFFKIDYQNSTLNKSTYGWTGNGYLKLYEGGSGKSAKEIIPGTEGEFHVSAPTFSADGKEVLFAVTRELTKDERRKTGKADKEIPTSRVEIYSSKLEGDTWAKAVPFEFNDVKKYSVGDPFLSADGNTLYFSSDMEGTMGGTDLYSSTRVEGGSWTKPVSLGAEVNSIGNERFPTMDKDGAFYFSSDGRLGIGGLDIFKATVTADGIKNPVNMGYPINSPQDDFSPFMLSATEGYFASNREGGQGNDDIYSFKINLSKIVNLQVIVFDKETNAPLANAVITLMNKADNTPVKAITDENGMVTMPVDKDNNFSMGLAKDGYIGEDFIPVSTDGMKPGERLTFRYGLQPIKKGLEIRLDNIYYDLDKATLRADALPEVDNLYTIMRDNPTFKIQLNSHTDSRGKDAYNLNLSQRRAQSVVDYLTSKGIDESRLKAVGYGETRLVNQCKNGVKCTEEEHQLNRRTTFTILDF